jgi:hypothetical protein
LYIKLIKACSKQQCAVRRYSLAVAAYRIILNLEPEDREALNALGKIFIENGDDSDAVEPLERLKTPRWRRASLGFADFKHHRNLFPMRRRWQTYRTQNPVLARGCGFKSHLRYYFYCIPTFVAGSSMGA